MKPVYRKCVNLGKIAITPIPWARSEIPTRPAPKRVALQTPAQLTRACGPRQQERRQLPDDVTQRSRVERDGRDERLPLFLPAPVAGKVLRECIRSFDRDSRAAAFERGRDRASQAIVVERERPAQQRLGSYGMDSSYANRRRDALQESGRFRPNRGLRLPIRTGVKPRGRPTSPFMTRISRDPRRSGRSRRSISLNTQRSAILTLAKIPASNQPSA